MALKTHCVLGWIQQILSTLNIVGMATYLLRFPGHLSELTNKYSRGLANKVYVN